MDIFYISYFATYMYYTSVNFSSFYFSWVYEITLLILLILPFFLQIFTSYFKKISLPLSCMLPFSLGNEKKKILNMADQGKRSAKDTHVPKKRAL